MKVRATILAKEIIEVDLLIKDIKDAFKKIQEKLPDSVIISIEEIKNEGTDI